MRMSTKIDENRLNLRSKYLSVLPLYLVWNDRNDPFGALIPINFHNIAVIIVILSDFQVSYYELPPSPLQIFT